MMTMTDPERLETILSRYEGVAADLIPVLQDVQEEFNYLHHVQVCRGTTCHLHGGTRLQEGVIRRLGIEPGQTTPDGQFSLEQVKCVGKCGAAPVLAVDADYFGEVGVDGVTKILRTYRKPK
jgi:NADH:ubiquinone oxidoreductase subunit E